MTTQRRILESAALEIERNGLTQFRVKRVASQADISVATLYSYFANREDLIRSTIVDQFEHVLFGQTEIFTRPLHNVNSPEELRAALKLMIEDALVPERNNQRLARIDGMSFAHHNTTASEGIAAAKAEASDRIFKIVKPLEERGFLASGVTAVAFARIWYALFFGQVALEGDHALSIKEEEWVAALQLLANSFVTEKIDSENAISFVSGQI